MKKRLTAFFLAFALVFALLPAAVLTASAEVYSGTCGENLSWTLDTETGVLEITGTGEIAYDKVPWINERDLITSVLLPDGLTNIGNGMFHACHGLKSITIPDSVTDIGNYAFKECTELTGITIPNSVTSIGYYAFSDCKKLSSIEIPDDVTSIGFAAFDNTGYYYDSSNWVGGILYIQNHLIKAKDSIAGNCSINYGTKTIADCAFEFCTSMTSVTIPVSVTNVGREAFSVCTSLTDVNYPGTEAEWNAILIQEGNDYLTDATAHFNYKLADSFADVMAEAWYYDAVNYALAHGLMNGVGNNNFAPDSPMTRAMLVTVLHRYEGTPKEGENIFNDVPAGQWYTDAVAWAAANKIVGGVGNGRFDPNGNITREQMATILFRYAGGKGFDTSKRGDLSAFPDAGKVSDWAKDAIAWAVGEGIINGSDGKLLPQGNATRAQVATILMRFIEGIAKK